MSEELRWRFRNAKSVFVLTGAGVSAESGVPTFRGRGESLTWKGLPVEMFSSVQMVERDLPAVWEWFDYRRSFLADVKPNPAHIELAHWQSRFGKFCLATQNVDGLHQQAGSRNVIELHGSVWRARCISCEARFRLLREGIRPELCETCGDRLRPDVVLFGELLPRGTLELAAEQAESCELCFVIGTSAIVYPAASLPEVASAAGAFVCEINPEQTTLSPFCDEVLTGKAGEILPLITGSVTV
jgi:NAD-dependent protein deacetylase/lipoamidase